MKKIQKNTQKKIFGRDKKKKEWENDAGTTIKWLGIGWGGSEIQELKFNSINPVDKENSIWGRKVQNQMFMDSIKFYPRLIEFMEGLIAKKLIF